MLEQRLLGSLRVSKKMLGLDDEGFTIGEGSGRRVSINFAKNAQRLQNGLRQGISRLAQVHLAYRGKNPDPTRFDIQLAEISTAEEEELKNALDKGVDIVDKLMDVLEKAAAGNALDRLETLDYLNQKILKLDDLDLTKLVHKLNLIPKENLPPEVGENVQADIKAHSNRYDETMDKLRLKMKKRNEVRQKRFVVSSDLFQYLPTVSGASQQFRINEKNESVKEIKEAWKPFKVKINLSEEEIKKKVQEQMDSMKPAEENK